MPLPPNPDPKTPCQKHADAIEDLQVGAGYANAATERLVRELLALEARVAALEAHLATPGYFAVPILGTVDSDTGAIAWTAGQPPEVT